MTPEDKAKVEDIRATINETKSCKCIDCDNTRTLLRIINEQEEQFSNRIDEERTSIVDYIQPNIGRIPLYIMLCNIARGEHRNK